MNQRLIHDAAIGMAHVLPERMQGCLREEERRDAFDEFYEVCKAGIEAFNVQQERLIQRV